MSYVVPYLYYTLTTVASAVERAASLFTPTCMQINPKLQHGDQSNLKRDSDELFIEG